MAALLLINGCSARMGNMTILSTENLPALNIKNNHAHFVQGESCEKDILFLIPWGEMQNKVQIATERAIENGHKAGLEGKILVNTKIDMKVSSWIIYNRYCVVVQGQLEPFPVKEPLINSE